MSNTEVESVGELDTAKNNIINTGSVITASPLNTAGIGSNLNVSNNTGSVNSGKTANQGFIASNDESTLSNSGSVNEEVESVAGDDVVNQNGYEANTEDAEEQAGGRRRKNRKTNRKSRKTNRKNRKTNRKSRKTNRKNRKTNRKNRKTNRKNRKTNRR